MTNLAPVLGVAAVVVVAVFTVPFVVGRRIGRYNIVDIAWGTSFLAVTVAATAVGDGDAGRRLLLLGLVGIWAVRLTCHMYKKSAHHGDARYDTILGGDTSTANVLNKVFVVQAGAVWFVSLPIQFAAVAGPSPAVLHVVTGLGCALWLFGFVFEAVADAQLQRFKALPANSGRIFDGGLWAWSRHPNYFGDACVWWGIWMVTITNGWSLATVVSPLFMTYLLVSASGGRFTERHMAGRPDFAEYCARTSFFVPRPPR